MPLMNPDPNGIYVPTYGIDPSNASKENVVPDSNYIPTYGIDPSNASKENVVPDSNYIPPYGPAEDAPDHVIKGMEEAARKRIKEEAPKRAILDKILNNFPNNSDELLSLLQMLEFRVDFMKELLERSRNQFIDLATKFKNDFSPEASKLINTKLTEYLCLIETLKSYTDYNFGSETNSYNKHFNYFDGYKPDLKMTEIIVDIMHQRRINGADIDIIFPINYDLSNIENQPKCNAVTVAYNVDQHLQNNPNMGYLWEKAGYQAPKVSNKKI